MPRQKKQAPTLGEKIKKMRLKKKVKIEDLANQIGYSPETIRKFEEGEMAPPVAALLQISKALQIDSGKFLSNEDQKERRVRRGLKRTAAYSYQTLDPGGENQHLSAYLVTIDPKQAHKMVEYRHEGEEFIYVLEGKIEVFVGENRNVVEAGRSIHFNSGITHKLTNLSESKSRLIVVIYTP